MAKETVRIHNKEYETVASRLNRFREEHNLNLSVITEIIEITEEKVVVKALIKDKDVVIATGHAEEKRGSSNINRTSALENAETSAVGRALAFVGYAGSDIVSAEEVSRQTISFEQATTIKEWLEQHAIKEDGFLNYMGVKDIENILVQDYDRAINALKIKAEKKKK